MRDEEALEKFKAFCVEQVRLQKIARGMDDDSPEFSDIEERCVDINDERDWYDMSIGFFIGIGCDVSQSIRLALDARYEHHYWCD